MFGLCHVIPRRAERDVFISQHSGDPRVIWNETKGRRALLHRPWRLWSVVQALGVARTKGRLAKALRTGHWSLSIA